MLARLVIYGPEWHARPYCRRPPGVLVLACTMFIAPILTLQCLGGMADGPCGEQFKAAFSCFVYSEAEPKGLDCVEKFQAMQDCFREHPEVYGEGE